MIEAKHSAWFAKMFDLYLHLMFRHHFKRIEVHGAFRDKGLPLLVLANHISWWDGFWILKLNKTIFRRRFHVMMLEDQLEKNRFLRRLGAFSIKPRSRSMILSLNYASELLDDPRNMLLIFPQGEIGSQHRHRFDFRKGIGKILDGRKVQVVMVTHLIDYFSSPRPVLRQYIFSPDIMGRNDPTVLETTYNSFFETCLQQQLSLKA
jgi:1-acyl-sn-glycerol-3-phosphate acyltransferase